MTNGSNPLKNMSVQTVISLLGMVGILANVYLASKLAPLVQSVSAVAQRVEALETYRNQTTPLVERFIVSEGKIAQIQTDVADMKTDLKDIKSVLYVPKK